MKCKKSQTIEKTNEIIDLISKGLKNNVLNTFLF